MDADTAPASDPAAPASGADGELDLDFVRASFPAFSQPELADWSFFENAGGSYPCAATVDALTRYYTETKVQPYAPYPASTTAGEAMDSSRARWAAALGVDVDEVIFGPSTTANTYVLAHAFAPLLGPGTRVVVTNQDHEANTGAIRRVAAAAGAEVVEWGLDPATGLLHIDRLADLLTPSTVLVTMPHCSNIVGMENDVTTAARLCHDVGARLVVDGVSFAPHGLPAPAAIDADVYLFSLYKVYSVHQGVMVVRNGLLDELPNQGHGFNAGYASKRLAPAGPDHAQEAAAGAVLDYVEALHAHHGGGPDVGPTALSAAVSRRWQAQEQRLLVPLLQAIEERGDLRLLGPGSAAAASGGPHRCPTVALDTGARDPHALAAALAEHGVMCGAGDFYAVRVIEALGIDPDPGVLRLSFVHYTSDDDLDRLLGALDAVLA